MAKQINFFRHNMVRDCRLRSINSGKQLKDNQKLYNVKKMGIYAKTNGTISALSSEF